ncbi:MAG: sulfatase-like hydrolase/transferase, partial [Pirellulaceae bacterium]
MEQTTLADLLKQAGYRHPNIGKWHLPGTQKATTQDARGGFLFKPPHERGFDEFVGITGGMDNFWPGTERERWSNDRYQRLLAPDYLTDFFGTEACDYIERLASQAFFLYLSFNAPHAR